MVYRYRNRDQITFVPDSLKKYGLADDRVRVYDAFIDALGVSSLGLLLENNKVGNSIYDPMSILKISLRNVYGFVSS